MASSFRSQMEYLETTCLSVLTYVSMLYVKDKKIHLIRGEKKITNKHKNT